MECAREFRIMELEKELKLKDDRLKNLEKKQIEFLNLESSIQHIFTPGQISRLKNTNKKMKWSLDDISSATCLHSAGPRAYRFMYKKNYPLPGVSTLRQWATKINIKPGILDHV